MKQGVLAGRTAGLRPAQKRRLERLCHRRHPEDQVAELLCLQRLASESLELELPLTLVVDGRGLCRLLWVGPLEQSGRLLERLPGSDRRQGSDLRLLTCCGRSKQLEPGRQEGLVGLDLAPLLWLRFGDRAGAGGQWPGQLLVAQPEQAEPWVVLAAADLSELCGRDPLGFAVQPQPRQGRRGFCCWPSAREIAAPPSG